MAGLFYNSFISAFFFLFFKVNQLENDNYTSSINLNVDSSIEYKYSIAESSSIPHTFNEMVKSSFDSSFDVSNYSEEQAETKRRPKIKRTWSFEKKFSNHNDATIFVNSENLWSTSTTNNIAQGKKVLYRCKKAKQKGQQCEAGVSLLFCANSDEVIMHRAENQHTCQLNRTPRNPMTVELKDKIARLFKDGLRKRREIETQLAAECIGIPSITQLNNLIRNLRYDLCKENPRNV